MPRGPKGKKHPANVISIAVDTEVRHAAKPARASRLILKGQKIREILGGSLGVLDDFPARPKGMHWRRYNRLRHLHDQAVEGSLATLSLYINRLGKRLT
jgi:hypothetical protein